MSLSVRFVCVTQTENNAARTLSASMTAAVVTNAGTNVFTATAATAAIVFITVPESIVTTDMVEPGSTDKIMYSYL